MHERAPDAAVPQRQDHVPHLRDAADLAPRGDLAQEHEERERRDGTAAGPPHRRDPDRPAGRAAAPVPARSASGPPTSTATGVAGAEHAGAETAQTDAGDTEPELARPERRLDTELPRQPSDDPTAHDAGRNLPVHRSSYRRTFTASLRSLEPISDLEAAAFAGRFAADFQSFDEDDPTRRSTVLRPLLADPQAGTWGWSGRGRQRAESPLPGRMFRSSDTVVFVEVLVRATTYARTRSAAGRRDEPHGDHVDPVGIVGPASVPPESSPGWVAVEANWLRMTVPITRSPDDGRLVVDPHLVPEQTT